METASRQLQAKFAAARAVFEKTLAAGLVLGVARALFSELAALEVKLALTTGHLYIAAAAGESGRVGAHAEFARILATEDFSGGVDRLVRRVEGELRGAGVALRSDDGADAAPRRGAAARRGGRAPPAPARRASSVPAAVVAELQRLLDRYPQRGGEERAGPASGAVQRVNYECCPACGADMAVDAGRSELRCGDEACGALRNLIGTVFDDSQFYSQEGQKAKSGTFNPNRHFQFWWCHILAREPVEEIGDKDDPENLYGERLLAQLRAIVARDRLILCFLSVDNVRAMLREIDRTDLNKDVPLILKELTGIGPPQIADSIAVRVENLFSKAIEASDAIEAARRAACVDRKTGRPVPDARASLCRQLDWLGLDDSGAGGRVNRNYYPFYISKLLEQILPADDNESRRVFYYIYVQSKETVEADDANWEQICEVLDDDGIKYVPTDRTLGLKYRPQC
jgi:hypothetical protein